MEILVLGFPMKDLHEGPHLDQDSQKESSRHKAVYQGCYTLKVGDWAGSEVAAILGLGLSFLFMFA